MENCIFCRIAAGEIPALKVYENDALVAFLDIQPANPGHTLIVSKRHYPTLADTPDEELGPLFVAAKMLGKSAAAAVGAGGFNIIVNNGPVAGQIIPHVHIHAIPRFEDDGHRHWSKKSVSQEEMVEIAGKIAELSR
ncbi:MAG: HIT family protein [Patescibacteria group bacterium]|jgi:histidine triad (HIT) family protein